MKQLISLLGSIGAAWFMFGCKSEPYQKPILPVRVQAVGQSMARAGARYSAGILPGEQVAVAFRVGDYVSELLQVRGADGRTRAVQEGDWVEKGAVLARLRESTYLAKVDQARQQLAQAEASLVLAESQISEAETTLAQAQRDFDRAAKLFESQSLTRPEYDGAQTRLQVTRDKVAQARAQKDLGLGRVEQAKAVLREADNALQDCALKAPMRGMVLKKAIEVGSLVGPGSLGFVIAEMSSVKAVFGVSDVSMAGIRLGDAVTLAVEGLPGQLFKGRISRISPMADPKSRIFDVEATVPNTRLNLKAGMVASLQSTGEKSPEPVPVVPLSAIVRPKNSPDAFAVFVVEDRNEGPVARMREIGLGETFGNTIAVTSGLKAGERVIVSGASIVVDGERVQIVS